MSRSIRMQGLCRGTVGRPRHGCAMKRLSIIIVARNEAINIADCVRSARFADEVIVLDSRQHRRHGRTGARRGRDGGGDRLARLRPAEQPRHRRRRRRLVLLARRRRAHQPASWRPRSAPRSSATMSNGYRVPRTSMYCGRFIQHGGWSPDYTWRLARRGAGRFTDAFPARAPCRSRAAPARCGTRSSTTASVPMESVLEKLNRYSTASARDMTASRRRGSLGPRDRPRAVGVLSHLRPAAAVSWTAAGASCWRCRTPRAPTTATSSCG